MIIQSAHDRWQCSHALPPVFLFTPTWYKFIMDVQNKQSTPLVLWVLIFSVVVVLGQSMYVNYIKKDYVFYLEAKCDSVTNECYSRSCENDGDCPPNGLTVYRVFQLPASEFKNCSDNSCLNICPSSASSCEEVLCSTQSDISCEGPTYTSTTPTTTATTTS